MTGPGGFDPGSGSRVLVTGGAGFVGSHLVRRLAAEGCRVLVLDDLSTGQAGSVPPGVELERLDIATDDLDPPIRAWRPDVVHHLAAQTSVPASMADPLRDLAVNVVGTHRLSAAARSAGSRRLVFVSSGGAVYGSTTRAVDELGRPRPSSYYGIHKLAAEAHVVLSGLPNLVLRPSNIYGPGQRSGREGAVVASFVEQAFEGGALHIHGDGSQTRDLLHVDDAVEAIVHLGRIGALGIWNVSAGRSTSVGKLADIVERSFGRPLERSYGPPRSGDVQASAISSAKLRRSGWRPGVSLDAGVVDLIRRRWA